MLDFIKSWKRGVKCCRTTLSNPDTKLKFTLYPMLHIASAEFYETIAEDLGRFQYVLDEGVTWQKDGKSRPLYDWAAANLGLAAQRDALRYPDGCSVINIDLPHDEFRTGFLGLPWRYRLLMIFFRPLMWVVTKIPAAKEYLFTSMTVGEARKYEKNETEMDELIVCERDQYICAKVEEFEAQHRSSPQKTFVAVVFGAQHMIRIARCLRNLGYHPTTKRWFEMMRPDESTDVHEEV